MSNVDRRRSYRPGGWFGIFGDHASVLLPPTEKHRVPALWELIDEGAGFDEVLDALLSSGLRGLPGFVLVSESAGITKVVLRGAAVAAFVVDGDMIELAGSTDTTWVERSFVGATQMFVQVEATDEEDGEDLLIENGLVRLGRVDQPPFTLADDVPPVDEAAAGSAEPEALEGAGAEESGADDPGADEPEVDRPEAEESVAEETVVEGPEVEEPAAEEPAAEESVAEDESAAEDAEGSADTRAWLSGAVPAAAGGFVALDEPGPGQSADGSPEAPEAFADAPLEDTLADAPAIPEAPPAQDWAEAASEQVAELGGEQDADPFAEQSVEPSETSPPEPQGWQEPDDNFAAVAPAFPRDPGLPDVVPSPASDHDGLTSGGLAGGEGQSESFERPQSGVASESDQPATGPSVAKLVFSSGEIVDVDRAILVGRSPEVRRFAVHDRPRLVPVPSPHQEISSTHLEVRPGVGADHGSAVVTDLGSTNGTVLVQPGLPPEDLQPGIAVQLVPGAIIDLGDGVTIQVTQP